MLSDAELMISLKMTKQYWYGFWEAEERDLRNGVLTLDQYLELHETIDALPHPNLAVMVEQKIQEERVY